MRKRTSAPERRAQVIRAAVPVFARRGYEGATMREIAREAAVAQPYLFQLFESKKSLFMMCIRWTSDLIRDEANRRAEIARERGGLIGFQELASAYAAVVEDDVILQFLLQCWASACGDVEVETLCREEMERTEDLVRQLTGETADNIDLFMARGALMTVRSALKMPKAVIRYSTSRAEVAPPPAAAARAEPPLFLAPGSARPPAETPVGDDEVSPEAGSAGGERQPGHPGATG